MKIYISVDSEGISGIVKYGSDEKTWQRWMTEDANAAAAGAFDGGATEVVVKDAHGSGVNIDAEQLDERAHLISGWKPEGCMLDALDNTYAAVMLVGCHSRMHTEGGVLCHTYSGVIDELRLNGRPFGEGGLSAAVAGHFGIPVVLVAGDEAATTEVRNLIGEVETVAVKRGLARDAALLMPLKKARHMIREAAKRAVSDLSRFKAFTLAQPIRMEIDFQKIIMADLAALVPGVEKTGPRRIAVSAADAWEMWRLFRVFIALSRTV
jgi:D-amino peptidase